MTLVRKEVILGDLPPGESDERGVDVRVVGTKGTGRA